MTIVAAPTTAQQPVSADIELGWKNYSRWRDHILPTRSELKFKQIPWLSTFEKGILAGNEKEKPVLLWVMNGHPLGCTGAKLSTQLFAELKRRDQKYGMVTACVGGGQGIAGIYERL